MAISDAQFDAWLADDHPREFLFEQKFAYESGGAPTEGTLYFSMGTYATPTQPYQARILKTPTFQRSIPVDGLGGLTTLSAGVVVLDNRDGRLDYLLRLIVDGREGRLLIGAPEGTPGWSRSDFRPIAVSLAEFVSAPNDREIHITQRDQRLLLDRAIAGDVVTDERRKPLVFSAAGGIASSVELVLKDALTLEYWAIQNFNAQTSITAVYDNGIKISVDTNGTEQFSGDNAAFTANAGTDTLTFAGHGLVVGDVVAFVNFPGLGTKIFAGLSTGLEYWVVNVAGNDFQLSLTKGGVPVNITGTVFSDTLFCYRGRAYTGAARTSGTVQLSAKPVGVVTADIAGQATSQAVGSGAVGELVRALIVDYGGISASAIDASLTNADAGILANYLRAARAVTGRENLLEVLDDILHVAQIWFGPDHLGTIYGGRLDLSGLSTATAAHQLSSARLYREPKVVNSRVIRGTIALRSQRNFRPLSFGEMQGAVTDTDRASFSGQFRAMRENTAPSGTSYASNWQAFFKTAVRVELDGAFASVLAELESMANEILGDFAPHLQFIDVETDLGAYAWRLGDVVRFIYPRYEFDEGQNCRIVGTAVDPLAERVQLLLATQTPPDYLTAVH